MSERRPTIRDAVRVGVAIEEMSGCRVAMNHAWLTALPATVAVKHLAAQGAERLLIRNLTSGFTWKNSWALHEAGIADAEIPTPVYELDIDAIYRSRAA